MAKQIHGLAELVADVQSRIRQGDTSIMNSLRGKDGLSYSATREKELQDAANALKDFLTQRIANYYSSYSPVMYGRTGGLLNSVLVEMTSLDSAKVYFNPGQSYGESVFGQGAGYKPALINEGWAVSSGNHKDTYRFGYYGGFNFVELAIGDAKNNDKFKHIDIEFNG